MNKLTQAYLDIEKAIGQILLVNHGLKVKKLVDVLVDDDDFLTGTAIGSSGESFKFRLLEKESELSEIED
jgi:hypothetical protein